MDDDPASLMLVGSVLASLHLRVREAASGEEGRQEIKVEKPDLLLLDLKLPGISGLELARELKSDPTTSDIPIFVLTASTTPLHQRAAIALGCAGYITKPVSPQLLRDSVRTALEGQGGGPA